MQKEKQGRGEGRHAVRRHRNKALLNVEPHTISERRVLIRNLLALQGTGVVQEILGCDRDALMAGRILSAHISELKEWWTIAKNRKVEPAPLQTRRRIGFVASADTTTAPIQNANQDYWKQDE